MGKRTDPVAWGRGQTLSLKLRVVFIRVFDRASSMICGEKGQLDATQWFI